MRLPLAVAVCAALALPAAVAAQPLGRLFVAPSGETFRGYSALDTWWTGADADHDGAITDAELTADFARVFRALDADRDGVLSADEIAAYEASIPELARNRLPPPGGPGAPPGRGGGGMGPGGMGPGRMGGEPPPGRGPGGPPWAANANGTPYGGEPSGGGVTRVEHPDGLAPYGFMNDPEPVKSADIDLSGSVTAAEFEARAHRVFRSLDMNADGRLMREELPEMQQR